MDEKDNFITYPFSKQLDVDLKHGHYEVITEDGEQNIIEAANAKDAISKCEGKKIVKLTYLGFTDKVILKDKELITKEIEEEPLEAEEGAAENKSQENSEEAADSSTEEQTDDQGDNSEPEQKEA